MDKEALFARKAKTETDKVPIGDLGDVTVRALSLAEIRKINEENASRHTLTYRMIAAALVDPVMTPEEVAQWLDDAPAGDCASLEATIKRLSAMDEGAQKSGVPEVRG